MNACVAKWQDLSSGSYNLMEKRIITLESKCKKIPNSIFLNSQIKILGEFSSLSFGIVCNREDVKKPDRADEPLVKITKLNCMDS